jgi:hypothetical protein
MPVALDSVASVRVAVTFTFRVAHEYESVTHGRAGNLQMRPGI